MSGSDRIAASQRVEHIRISRLSLPLKQPYVLSFRVLDHFDTFLVTILAEGCSGLGETTPLPGYSHEDPTTVWANLNTWAPALVGLRLGEALDRLAPHRSAAPFAATAIATAIESALSGGPPSDRLIVVPLLKTLHGPTPAELAAEVAAGLVAGYRTFKLKVGRDPASDAAHTRAIQQALAGRGAVRLDANQAYDLDQARRFCAGLEPEGIELFEQPFPTERWDWMATLSRETPLPLMLDESILDESDVDRVAEAGCARIVKLKLMKAGGMARLVGLIQHAQRAGLSVVVGNGVAADLGNYHEAIAAAPYLTMAGEMNGFLKLRESIFAEPLTVERGQLIIPAGYVPTLDPARVAAATVQQSEWRRQVKTW